MEPTRPSGTTQRRIELTIERPAITWFARPTVTVDGVGQPAQWGTGTWAVPADGATVIGVYRYNRLWRSGTATRTVGDADRLTHRSSWLPVGPGRLDAH